MKKCPYCAEEIKDAAVLCRYCKMDIGSTVAGTFQEKEIIRDIGEAAPTLISNSADNSYETPKKKPLFSKINMVVVSCIALVAIFGVFKSFGSSFTDNVLQNTSKCNLTVTYSDIATLMDDCGYLTSDYAKAIAPYAKQRFCQYIDDVQSQDVFTRSHYTIPGYSDGFIVRVGDLWYSEWPWDDLTKYSGIKEPQSIKWLENLSSTIKSTNSFIADGPRSSVLRNLTKLKTLLAEYNDGKVTELSSLC